jgi:hypothetical protein
MSLASLSFDETTLLMLMDDALRAEHGICVRSADVKGAKLTFYKVRNVARASAIQRYDSLSFFHSPRDSKEFWLTHANLAEMKRSRAEIVAEISKGLD